MRKGGVNPKDNLSHLCHCDPSDLSLALVGGGGRECAHAGTLGAAGKSAEHLKRVNALAGVARWVGGSSWCIESWPGWIPAQGICLGWEFDSQAGRI